MRSRVLLMSTYLLLIIAAYSVTKAVRDSLFVTKIGPHQLPFVYLLIAGAMGAVSLVYSRAVNRIGLHCLIRTTSLIAISNLFLFWLLFKNNSSVWFYVLYVWVSLFGAITASQFWLLATHVFNAREARRVYSWVGAGGILGGILGGALTNRLAHWIGTESLLLVCAGMVGATVILLDRIPWESRGHTSHPGNSALFRQVRESKHLSMMVLLLTIAVVVEAFIDYQYKLVAKQSIPSKDHLTAFFGSITFYIGILSLLFQMVATNRILKRFGVGWAILVLPGALFASFITLAMKPALWSAALLQLVDGGFSYSIHRSGMELLYLPIPPQTRNAVKGFIDTFVDRVGRAAGALLLLLFTAGVVLSIRALSLVAAGLVLAWIVMAIAVKKEYIHSFRLALEKKAIEPEALPLRSIDGATIQTLLAQLSSDDERQVLYALDLLSHTHPNRWRPSINALVQHRSSVVRARTIAVLAQWNDPALVRDDLLHHRDDETARIATASALRLYWNHFGGNRELLKALLRDPSPDVRREAIATAGSIACAEVLPVLIDALADKTVRRHAREALLKFGDDVIPELIRRLAYPHEKWQVRRRIPKTLALTGSQAAADALIRQYHHLDYRLAYVVLRALNRMRFETLVEIDRDLVDPAIRKELQLYEQSRAVRIWLQSHPIEDSVFPLLIRALDERVEQRLERIFLLIALIYSPRDIYSVYYNCRLKPALRPAAVEFLDNLLDPPLKHTLVPLLDEAFESEKVRGMQQSVQFISHAAALATVRSGQDPWLDVIVTELVKRMENKSDEAGDRRVITH
jgi:ATP/ADP translocase